MTQRLGVHCCLLSDGCSGSIFKFNFMTDSEAADPGILSVLLCCVLPLVFVIHKAKQMLELLKF